MKALVLSRPGRIESSPLQLRDVPLQRPREREILVRVEACAVCRTDLHVVEGELPPVRDSVIPGHQVVGIVEGCGAGATRFTVGERVGIAWLRWTCGACRYCRAGKENLCPDARFTGYHEDGGYAEYAVVLEEFAYRLPDTLPPAAATPLLCAGIIGYRALRQANIHPGCRLGLYGFGSSAHIAIQVARHLGCTVYVMTRGERHQRLARELGAAWAGPADAVPPDKLDSAVLFAPAGGLVLPASEALDKGGTLAVAGIYLSDIPSLNYQRHLFHEKTIRSVTANTRQDGEELLRLAGEIPLRPQTTRFALADANEALLRLKRDQIQGSGVLVVEPPPGPVAAPRP
jgi:propanol-preferring alcohol dehydrogenase